MAETDQKDHNEIQDYNKIKSTVLMIDPFPSEPGTFNNSTELTTIMSNTLGAIIGQARVKPATLIDALDSHKAGQFLIAPVRYEKIAGKEETIEGKKAIACGSLDGFGGFVSKEFRIHDYFLGRANCEKFLRDHFTIPADTSNPIFVKGYAGIKDKTQYTSKLDKGLQIIPIFTERHSEPYMPYFANGTQWPSVSVDYIHSYRKLIKARVEKVLLNFTQYSKLQHVLILFGARLVLNGKIADAVTDTVIKSLRDHELIK
jgi:hypothetical protein